MTRLWAALLAVVLATTACKTYSSRTVVDPGPGIARLKNGGTIQEEVNRLAQPLVEKGAADGFAVGILTPAGTEYYGYGKTGRISYPEPPAADTVFEVGSVAKLFVTLVLARLVEDGRLRYEDTVRDILPPEVEVNDELGKVTLYELVMHTSGLPRQPGSFTQLVHFIKYLLTGKNLYSYIDKDFLYKYVRKHRVPPKAERSYAYSNIGAGLLAHLIELRTGKSLPVLVDELVTGPLGMRDTTYALTPEQRQRLATGHAGGQPRFVPRHTPLPPWDLGEIMNPTAGMYSTVNDLLLFARVNLGQTNHPLTKLIVSTQEIQVRREEEDVAFGWIYNHFTNPDTTIMYKHGMVAGYHAYIGMLKERQIAVVVLCNTFGWRDAIGHNLLLRIDGALDEGANPAAITKRGG